MFACCGIDCSRCDCFQAAQDEDEQKKSNISSKWSAIYGVDIKPSQIHCKGCLAADQDISVFCTDCEVRRCCRGKNYDSCASCDMFPCTKIIDLLTNSHSAEQFLKLFDERYSV